MKTSTNALTKRYCESKGWLCGTVQAFYGGRRHDLFGIADSIILKPGRLIFAQNCSYGSLKAHRDAISSHEAKEAREAILNAGAVVVLVEWRRKKAKRGGKRISRLWWARTQVLSCLGWGELTEWDGPHDFSSRKK